MFGDYIAFTLLIFTPILTNLIPDIETTLKLISFWPQTWKQPTLNRHWNDIEMKKQKKTPECLISLAFLNFWIEFLGLHSHYKVELLLIYLSFLKIVHHFSSLFGDFNKGTQKIILFYIQNLIKNLIWYWSYFDNLF